MGQYANASAARIRVLFEGKVDFLDSVALGRFAKGGFRSVGRTTEENAIVDIHEIPPR
jgi:hypothetical protein